MIRLFSLVLLLVGGLLLPVSISAGDDQFCSDSFSVRSGEEYSGDRYYFASNVDISGVHDGDLIGLAQVATIGGEVRGDVFYIGQSLDIGGRVTDSVRVWCNGLTITGTIEGDVIAMCSTVNIHPRARITGNLIMVSGSGFVDGQIDGSVKFTGGKVAIGGTVGRDVEIQADGIDFGPDARIAGDLVYTARKPLPTDPGEFVGGEVRFEEKVKKSDEPKPFWSASSIGWWLWQMISALLVGLVVLAGLRTFDVDLAAPIRDEPLMGGLIGFGVFLVEPAASILAILLIVTLPLGVISLGVFLVAVYLAKVPVALWLGQRLLGWVGRREASPFVAFTLGIVVLSLMFRLPFFLGTVVWIVTVWLGLGAMVLALRGSVQPARSSAEVLSE